MKTNRVTPEVAGLDRKRTFFRFLFTVGLFATVDFLFDMLWRSPTSPHHLLGDSIEAVLGGIFFAFFFGIFFKRILSYDVVVSDECFTRLHPWLGRRSVRKDEANTVTETTGSLLTAPALRISRYGQLGTWFWGGIWIPKAVPEYEYARDLALNWKSARRLN